VRLLLSDGHVPCKSLIASYSQIGGKIRELRTKNGNSEEL